jgi:hypothetical protein
VDGNLTFQIGRLYDVPAACTAQCRHMGYKYITMRRGSEVCSPGVFWVFYLSLPYTVIWEDEVLWYCCSTFGVGKYQCRLRTCHWGSEAGTHKGNHICMDFKFAVTWKTSVLGWLPSLTEGKMLGGGDCYVYSNWYAISAAWQADDMKTVSVTRKRRRRKRNDDM